MKTSIAHLPAHKQQELRSLIGTILAEVPETRMIILYGSYARGNYVEFDARVEFGVPTEFRSDYDIEVVVSDNAPADVSGRISAAVAKHEEWFSDSETPIQVIHDSIKLFKKNVRDLRSFYVDMVEDGVLLYKAPGLTTPTVPSIHSLPPEKILALAEGYFKEKMETSGEFMAGVKLYYEREKFPMAAFMLHQAAENLLHCIPLVFTLYSPKIHDLEKLYPAACKHDGSLPAVFPRNTEEEKRLFDLLKRAYVEGRYNPGFEITREDLDTLITRVEQLRDVTRLICTERIEFYKSKTEVAAGN